MARTAKVTSSAPCEVDWVTLNQNGAGYYRFSMDTKAWADLVENIDQLNTREALTVLDSLVAAFRAGEVEASVFLDGMSAFAVHPEYDVASGSTRLLGFMQSELADSRDDLARHVTQTYKSRYGRIVGAPNMLGLALRETMRERGEEAYQPLLELAAKGSSLEKGSAAGALSATQSDTVYNRLLTDVVLAEDSPLTGRQAGTVLGGLLGSEKYGEQTWDWFKANIEAYAKKVPDVRKGGLPGAGGNFCSLERRDEVREFVEANADLMPGYERSLLQTLESIELCSALKDEKADELTAALKAR